MKSAGHWYKLGMVLYDGTYYAEALNAFDHALTFNAGDPYIPFMVYYWKGHIFDLLDNREEALVFYKKALQVYPGHPVMHSQYNKEIDEKWPPA
jgi:tetratricopeptide (TPR) repeat protein